MSPDLINSLLILGGGFCILLSVGKVLKDKLVRGVSWWQVLFFNTWEIWNLFFYSHLDQWLSLFAELFLVTTNLIYLYLLLYYTRKEKLNERLAKTSPNC